MSVNPFSNGELIGCTLRFGAKRIEKLTPYRYTVLLWVVVIKQEQKDQIWTVFWLPMKGGLLATRATFKSIKAVVPLLDRVLVQRFKPETKTASGLFLPTSSTTTPLPEATVIAVGPGAPDKDGAVVPTQVKAGDRVLLPGWGSNSIKVGDEEYFLFKDAEILAKIQE
ncbi:Cpn10-domain-containing protein [Armillaria gallica]|uniref:Cpn10-domain-containing protein n=1 Tax=Armillaria gallica TaxID=47427 RepID=A0A2H3D634_ARMGA|nr:Cpn10-domain-containing protein [Armillaria gallica]